MAPELMRAAAARRVGVIPALILAADRVDDVEVTEATEALQTQGDPPLVTVAFVAGLAVPGALVEVAAIAAVLR